MNLLLDTHVFLWSADARERLSDDARAAIESRDNDVFVSSAVAWEIAIKTRLGKLALPLDPPSYVASRMKALGFRELAITFEHALSTGSLPAIHADPFDRIMIAQASIEGLTFVTRDARSLEYPISSLLA